MASVGNIEEDKSLRGYETDPMHKFAEAFLDVARAGVNEGSVDMFRDPATFVSRTSTRDALKKFFVENSFDQKDPRFSDSNPNRAHNIQEHMDNMSQLFDNDTKCVVREAASPLGAFNPVIGMGLPMHKNILLSAVFDQVLPKDVAKAPKFSLTMETRMMYDTKGNRIDMFLEQNKMTPAINDSVPHMDVIVSVPEYATTDIVHDNFGYTRGANSKAHLSIKSGITGIVVNSYVGAGESYYDAATKTVKTIPADGTGAGVKPVIFPAGNIQFVPTYGDDYDRIIAKRVSIIVKTDATNTKTITGTINGRATKDDMFEFSFDGPDASLVTAIRFHAVLDVSSAAFPTVKFNWEAKTNYFEIPEAPHITCEVTPEAVKDIQALYDVNQITKLMAMMRLAMLHWKDDNIHQDPDDSFLNMPATNKVTDAIDWAPPVGQFMGSPIQWRSEMFMDQLEFTVSRMLQVLHDENMTVLVLGRPEIISRITPQQYQYQAPSNIGPVELDYQRTVVTSNSKRVYNFVSSQKMFNNNNLILLLIPRNSARITYKIIDYQLYVSNEIRDTQAYELPAMTCFERWLFLQYQPVQARVQIMNVRGTREQINNPDPIGHNAMSDFSANNNTYASTVNGVAGTPGTYQGQATAGAPVTAPIGVSNSAQTYEN